MCQCLGHGLWFAIAGYNLITVNQCRLCDLRAIPRVVPVMNQTFVAI